MLTNECERMVREFQTRILGWDSMPSNAPEVASLRAALIQEELWETVAAMRRNDFVEVADGLADLMYVVVGAGLATGARVPDCFVDPLPSDDALRMLSFQADSAYWAATVTQSLLDATMSHRGPDSSYRLGIALRGLAGLIARTAQMWDIPLKEVFIEVHRSNMTKTPAKTALGQKGGAKGPEYQPPDVMGVLVKAGLLTA